MNKSQNGGWPFRKGSGGTSRRVNDDMATLGRTDIEANSNIASMFGIISFKGRPAPDVFIKKTMIYRASLGYGIFAIVVNTINRLRNEDV